jgi:hypothetical protein
MIAEFLVPLHVRRTKSCFFETDSWFRVSLRNLRMLVLKTSSFIITSKLQLAVGLNSISERDAISEAPWVWILAGIIVLLMAQGTGIISFPY